MGGGVTRLARATFMLPITLPLPPLFSRNVYLRHWTSNPVRSPFQWDLKVFLSMEVTTLKLRTPIIRSSCDSHHVACDVASTRPKSSHHCALMTLLCGREEARSYGIVSAIRRRCWSVDEGKSFHGMSQSVEGLVDRNKAIFKVQTTGCRLEATFIQSSLHLILL